MLSESFSTPPVHVAQTDLQCHDGFPGDRETKVTWLYDASVHRPHWDLVDAFPLEPAESVFPGDPRHLGRGIEVLAERERALGPIVVQHQRPGVRMSRRSEPEHVLYLPLVPVGRMESGDQRRERAFRHVPHDLGQTASDVQDGVQRERPGAFAFIGCVKAHQPSTGLVQAGDHIGEPVSLHRDA